MKPRSAQTITTSTLKTSFAPSLKQRYPNIVNVLKISQKEKISSTVTPQQAFDDMRDLSMNSIPENTEKVNTLDEKNLKPLNDEAPIGADNVDKHSQDELRAELEESIAHFIAQTSDSTFSAHITRLSRSSFSIPMRRQFRRTVL